jgi:hypothetical protein
MASVSKAKPGAKAQSGLPDENDISGAYIDVDEWRDRPVRHRYVHGGFKDTHTRFSFYFPPVEKYRGRFIQYLEGGAGGHETLLAAGGLGPAMSYQWMYGLCFDELGGYMVESNQGHFPGEGLGFENDYELYGASAQSALFARTVAADMYGDAPHHGYVWGVSGGGARSGRCLENRPDIWQGGAPHAGIGQSTQWSPWAMLWLIARDKFAAIIDASEPGGSGNPFDQLDTAQREALAELYRRGFPRGAESQLAPFMAWAFPFYTLKDNDPAYFLDFWSKPGYAGHDDPASLERYVVNETLKVKRTVPASETTNFLAAMNLRLATAGAMSDPTCGVVLDTNDCERLFLSKATVLTGKAKGRELLISSVENCEVSPFSERAPDVFNDVEAGDEIHLDNRDFIAFCFYHRHAIEKTRLDGGIDRTFSNWTLDERPIYPQREGGPTSNAAPTTYKGIFESKMIYVQPTLDAQVWPTTIFPYIDMVEAQFGDRTDNSFRIWFVENSPHGAPEFLCPALTPEKDPGVWSTRLVGYDGVTAEALRQVVRWVEEDVPPTFYRGYGLSADNALVLPESAAERGGVQPVAILKANGTACARVKVGQVVEFTASAQQPAQAGTLVAAVMDFTGRGLWEHSFTGIDGKDPYTELSVSHAYAAPGIYFPSFRVSAHSLGLSGTGPAIENLARVRVIVET